MARNSYLKHHPYARYATDVMFQQAPSPAGIVQDKKQYHSGRHHLYGWKNEVFVLPNGHAIHVSNPEPGSVAEIEIFRKGVQSHKESFKKSTRDLLLMDGGELGMFMKMSGPFYLIRDKGVYHHHYV